MTTRPLLNAALVALYIVGIIFVVNTLMTLTREGPESVLISMTMLSLFVLSAAVTAYLFLAEPFRLYFEGQKQEAITLFLKTVAAFACFALLFVAALLYTSLS